MMEDREPATMVHEEQPAKVAPAASAFAWGNEPRREEQRTDEIAASSRTILRWPRGETGMPVLMLSTMVFL